MLNEKFCFYYECVLATTFGLFEIWTSNLVHESYSEGIAYDELWEVMTRKRTNNRLKR